MSNEYSYMIRPNRAPKGVLFVHVRVALSNGSLEDVVLRRTPVKRYSVRVLCPSHMRRAGGKLPPPVRE